MGGVRVSARVLVSAPTPAHAIGEALRKINWPLGFTYAQIIEARSFVDRRTGDWVMTWPDDNPPDSGPPGPTLP